MEIIFRNLSSMQLQKNSSICRRIQEFSSEQRDRVALDWVNIWLRALVQRVELLPAFWLSSRLFVLFSH